MLPLSGLANVRSVKLFKFESPVVLMKANRREFSQTFAGRNLEFVTPKRGERQASRVGFLLLGNFSLPCFTQALDVLVTANLISPGTVQVHTFSYNHTEVMSDLGIPIRPSTPLTDIRLSDLDLLVICGGMRSTRTVHSWLSNLLTRIAKLPITLGGLWNGAWYMGATGLLNGYRCAIHPEQRVALAEKAPYAEVCDEVLVLDRDRMTSTTPAGAFQMMIRWLALSTGREVADAVLDKLDHTQNKFRSFHNPAHPQVNSTLKKVITLMESNLEEPLTPDRLAEAIGISTRQIQRLFISQLNTTPQKYYIQLRITEARRLMQNSSAPIRDVSIACGFVSYTHFSRLYRAFFGHPPSQEARN